MSGRSGLQDFTLDDIPYSVWKNIQSQVQHAIFVGRGIHTDELQSYDSFIPIMMDMVRQLRPQYDDQASGKRYVMQFSNFQITRPWHPEHGPINPLDGILLGHYDALVHADVWYEIYGKQPVTQATSPLEPDRSMDEDMSSPDPPLPNPSKSLDEEISTFLSALDRIDVEPELEPTDEDTKVEPRPKVADEDDLPGFYVDREDANSYPYLLQKSPAIPDFLVCRLPAYVLSSMCQMQTPFAHPESYFKPSNVGCTFPVSHIHKICPGAEHHAHNIYLDDSKPGVIECRLTFVDPEKQGRTNSTLKFSLFEPVLNGKRPSAKDDLHKYSATDDVDDDGKSGVTFKKMYMNGIPRFRLEIPHETPKVHASIAVFCMAYGWTMPDILDAVRRFIGRPVTPAIQWYLDAIAHHVDGCKNQSQAIQRIGRCFTKCRKDSSGVLTPETIASFVSHTLMTEFYPNLNSRCPEVDNVRKGYELCRVMAALIVQTDLVNHELPEHLRWKPQDGRSYVDKRLQMPGDQLVTFFRMAFKDAAGRVAVGIRRAVRENRPISIQALFDPNLVKIGKGIRNGVFDVKKMTEATQANQRRTQAAVTGFGIKNVHMQVSSIRKFTQGRHSYDSTPILTHPTQRNRIDPYVTPESENCGSTRYKCPECWVTGYVDLPKINRLLVDIASLHGSEYGWVPVRSMKQTEHSEGSLVPPNMDHLTAVYDALGGICGWVSDFRALYHRLVSYRRQSVYPAHITFSYEPVRRLFFIHADAGRMLSPLLIRSELPRLAVNLDRLRTLRDPSAWLLDNGYMEYVCAAEEYRSSAFDPSHLLLLAAPRLEDAVSDRRYTHVAVHPSNMFSLTDNASYVNMNQGPRIMHSANNGKRAMPFQWAPWDNGTHEAYQLATRPERPLTSSPYDVSLLFPSNCEPCEQHVVVAMLTHASNIEDAVVMRKGLIDRGFGASLELSILVCKSSQDIQFRRPSYDVCGVSSLDKYHALSENGIPRVGAVLRGEDAIVGRVLQYQDSITGKPRLRDVSQYLPVSTYTYRIAHIEWMENRAGSILQVYVQKIHRPEKGDKFYFPYGQKFTVGRILSDADMCFIGHGEMLAGTAVDILVNPLALSRGTVGMLIAMMSNTARLVDPMCIDPYDTVFLSDRELQCDLNTCREMMHRAGLTSSGRTLIYNGESGRPVGHCVVGVLPVRVLKHIAKSKMRARSHEGKVDQLTRQPVSGQKDNGGLRQGEMERTNIGPSCGMSETAHDGRHVVIYWCTKCQIQAIGHVATDTAVCQGCGSKQHICRVHQSYVGVLVSNELEAAGFGVLPMVDITKETLVRV